MLCSWWFYLIYLGLLVATGYGGARYGISIMRRKTDELKQQLIAQKEEIIKQSDEINLKNNRMLDSIRYAERIQQAMLPQDERITQSLPEHFIIFKTKDIVSGDFYWFQETKGVIFIAVADCTGHGVPGAFMSMIGTSLLHQIVVEKHITDPATILEYLHTGIRRALKQNELDADTQDGMDIALCRIDLRIKSVIFAGARRPLYYLDACGQLFEVKGDRRPIGGRQKEARRIFTAHRIAIGMGITLYLTTDGFADQNGTNSLKMGTRRLKELIAETGDKPLPQQQQALLSALATHQGDETQRDDITLIAVRIEEQTGPFGSF